MPALPWTTVVLEYVCPSIGCILASVMFAAPIFDLREALHRGRLGSLAPVPWAWMTGNCLGWYVFMAETPCNKQLGTLNSHSLF